MHRGGCLCGGITYLLTAEPGHFGYCHCPRCQKASGTAHAANAGVARANSDLSDPLALIRERSAQLGAGQP